MNVSKYICMNACIHKENSVRFTIRYQDTIPRLPKKNNILKEKFRWEEKCKRISTNCII